MKKITLIAIGLWMSVSAFSQQEITAPKHRQAVHPSVLRGATKSLSASIVALNFYTPGATMNLNFEINLSSPDFEYGDSLWMQFPAGFTINGASDSVAVTTEGQTGEVLNIPIVSPVVSWGDNDNNYGGIEPGSHTFYVNVTIPISASGPLTINWHLDGDEFGTAPNFTTGTTTITTVPVNPNMKITGITNNKYLTYPTTVPLQMTFGADVTNNGATLSSATKAYVSIPAAGFQDSAVLSNPFNTGAFQTVNFANSANITTVGTHNIFYAVNNTPDVDPVDNLDTLSFGVSDSVFAYVDTVTDNAGLGFGTGTEGVFGSVFSVSTTANLSSVSFYLPTSPDLTTKVSIVVYAVGAGGPAATPLFETDTFNLSGTGPTVLTHACNFSLAGGADYLIGIRKQLTGDLFIGRNSNGYAPDSHFAYFNGGWNEIGGLGFMDAQCIFANFSSTPASCQANFMYAIDGANPLKVAFTNTSSNPSGNPLVYFWNFGDGTGTANIANPVYTYAADGTYNACLNITDGANCSSDLCVDVTVNDGINSVSNVSKDSFKVYPNPSNGKFTLNFSKSAEVMVYGIDGSRIKTISIQNGTHELDLTEFPEGMYILKLTSGSEVLIKRISVVR